MGRRLRRQKKKEITDRVIEIISITDQRPPTSKFVVYTEEELNEARMYLRETGKKKYLLSMIEEEIKKRISYREKEANKNYKLGMWFTPRWNAVRALFGKGPSDLANKRTQDILKSIKDEWVDNYKGEI